MISLVIFLFVFGILILVHEFGHFIVAKKVGVRVERFSLGFGKVLLSRKSKGTEYTLNALPLGGYVKLAGDVPGECSGKSDEYLSKTPGQRAAIIFCGPLVNYLLGFFCFWLIFFTGYPTLTTKVGGLLDGFGAKDAGVQIGDQIISVDGQKVAYWEELQKAMQAKGNVPQMKFSILRNGKEIGLEIKIKEKEIQDLIGSKQSIGLIGITPVDEIITVRHSFWQSCFLGIEKTWYLTEMTYKALWRMITGRLSFRDSVTGPLGIFYITSKAAHLGIIALIHLMAVLNISLAIFNLLPLPVLDGGHILLLAIEKIRGRALSIKAEQVVTHFGLTLIITLAVIATYNDILKFKDKIFTFLK
ncbi:MAG: RIP metalloprotease RseP [Candidatus Omnitrophica bacterium]|jgi:regulator of sigma E protease|nr:RIP metalloprotease RseP [Candidatus Omnitrophota bacterium]